MNKVYIAVHPFYFMFINLVAVLVASLVGMAIGALWYSPLLFGNLWMNLSGMSKADMDKAKQNGMTSRYVIAFVALLVTNYILALFVQYAGATTFADGVSIGALVWLGFFAMSMLSTVLWENKSFLLYALQTMHYLIVLTLAAGILAVWG